MKLEFHIELQYNYRVIILTSFGWNEFFHWCLAHIPRISNDRSSRSRILHFLNLGEFPDLHSVLHENEYVVVDSVAP